MIHFLNCSEYMNCDIIVREFSTGRRIFFGAILLNAIIGFFGNGICMFVFFKTINMEHRFKNLLQLGTMNSLLINLNDAIAPIMYFSFKDIIYRYNTKDHFSDMRLFYFAYVYLPIWSIFYTFGGINDIFILYTRIQIFCPKLTFLAKVSAYKIAALTMMLAFIINIPINLSRQVVNTSFRIESNATTVLQVYGPSIYTKNRIFTFSVLAANFFRDLILVFIMIALNVIVIILLKQYMDRKFRLSTQTQEQIKISKKRQKTMRNNITIAVISGFLSALVNLVSFMIFIIMLLIDDFAYAWGLILISIYVNSIKHCFNLILFLIFNTKFRASLSTLFEF